MHENASNHDDSSNHDDPDDHEMVQESVNMCLNVLKRPVSALYYKIISIYTTIDTSLNLLTGLLEWIRYFFIWITYTNESTLTLKAPW